MSNGWIYLRKTVNLKGEAMAYCIGKTGNEKKRRKTYRKENPHIKHMEDYKTRNMKAAEDELKDFIKDNDMQYVSNSTEWLRAECFEEFYSKWEEVKGEWWVNKPKPTKREYIQPIGAGTVKPLPPVGKPRPMENWTEKEHLLAYAQEAARTPPPVPMASVSTQSNAPARKQIPAFWLALGEMIAAVFFCAVGVAAFILFMNFIGFIIYGGLGLAVLWVIGTLSGAGKRRRRGAW